MGIRPVLLTGDGTSWVNPKWHGPAASHLTLYIEPVGGKLRPIAWSFLVG